MVEHHVVADLGGLADHDAHAVVDEEASADRRAGMDLDAGQPARDLRAGTRERAAAAARHSACDTRCAQMACSPGYSSATSSALRAAGSRSRAAAMSSRIRPISPAVHVSPRAGPRTGRWRGSAHRCRGRSTTIFLPAFSGRAATFERRPDGGAAGHADEHALLGGELAGDRGWLLELDGDDLVDDVAVEDRPARSSGRCPGSCAGPGWPSVSRGESFGSTAMTWTSGLRCLEHLADAGDGAAGADAGDEDVDVAVGVAQDLLARWSCGGSAGSRRSRTAGPRWRPASRRRSRLATSIGAAHALGRVGEHELGAEGLEQQCGAPSTSRRAS